MSFATKEQLKELAAYMASQINVPTIGIGGGYAPIGTIIQYMGVTAPQDYLICDGTVYNIADYPQLAEFFTAQFGSANHFGGDGTTTFAVPDLRGEFLRGTGTNSHANNGNGADVGVHQDGTMNPFTMILDNATDNASQIAVDPTLSENPNSSQPHWWGAANIDYKSITNNKLWRNPTTTTGNVDTSGLFPSGYVARPTNTSVLYCIKAVVAGEVYSTEERVVGTWIDGKKIYQKTVVDTVPTEGSTKTINISSWNADVIIDLKAMNTVACIPANPFLASSSDSLTALMVWINDRLNPLSQYQNQINIRNTKQSQLNGAAIYITVQYTKTTD